jgi:hypothetical protein
MMNAGLKSAAMLAALLAAAPICAGTIYKWVDKNGVVHYSDQPHPGAKPVQLPGLSGYSSTVPATPNSAKTQVQGAAVAYREFEITTPKSDETIHANDGKVSVSVALAPALRQGDNLVYTVDGSKIGTSRSTSLTLTNVVRGTHTLDVKVVDSGGKTVASAKPVTFYVRHHSVLQKKGPFSFPRGPKNPPPP